MARGKYSAKDKKKKCEEFAKCMSFGLTHSVSRVGGTPLKLVAYVSRNATARNLAVLFLPSSRQIVENTVSCCFRALYTGLRFKMSV